MQDNARMAELVDAPGSGSGVRKDVLVRLQFRALIIRSHENYIKTRKF